MTSGGEEGTADLHQKWLHGCREILVLTRRQAEAIGTGDFARLEELTRIRGEIMMSLGSLAEQPPTAGEDDWGEVARLLQETAALDSSNREQLAAVLEENRNNREQVLTWQQAARAYGGGADIPDPGVKA